MPRTRWTPTTRCAAIAAALVLAPPLFAQLAPLRLYCGVNRSIPVEVTAPATEPGDGAEDERPRLEIHLLGHAGDEIVCRADVRPGVVDLAEVFPSLWASGQPRVLYAQLLADARPVGAPLVLQPMLPPARARDGLSATALNAAGSGQLQLLRDLAALGPRERAELRSGVVFEPPMSALCSGFRVYLDQHVVLETTAGEIEIALRPDAAPNTAFHFLELVRGGFYTDVPFHRIAAEDGYGSPLLVQAGDPTGTGAGGPGFTIDFEPSALRHGFGVVSLARLPEDPNSGGSQFFICLSDDAARAFDGRFASFGRVVRGAETLSTLGSIPVGPVDPSDAFSPRERPLDAPRILEARAIPAPPIVERPLPVTLPELPPVER